VQAKDLLVRKGVPYIDINIEADEEAKLFLVARGFKSVPQINVDGVFLEGGLAGLAEQSAEFFAAHKTA
jgi:glutaredoxin